MQCSRAKRERRRSRHTRIAVEEVIKTHFKLKGPSILKQLDVWESEDDGKGTVQDSMTAIRSTFPKASPSAAFKKDLEDLRAELSAKRD